MHGLSKPMLAVVGFIVLVLLGGAWFAVDLLADANGDGSRSIACERALTEVVGSVPGVTSVSASCEFTLGASSQDQSVVLAAHSESDATATVEQVLRALAGDARIDDGWWTPQNYQLADGTPADGVLKSLGFNEVPLAATVRVKWSIEPAAK